MIGRYLTHPEVIIDPSVPIPDWGLSDRGRARVEALATSDLLGGTTAIISSPERKALDTAAILAKALGVAVSVAPDSHENDRSATGYLPKEAFEATADRFFAAPDTSIEGWETAKAAQDRIIRTMKAALKVHADGDILIVGHGAVGTLFYCWCAGKPISRQYDQTGGGGNIFTFDPMTFAALTHWTAVEDCIT